MNVQRPHRYQIHDSAFRVALEAGLWVVIEDYTVLDRHGQKDDLSRAVAWCETEAEAAAERDRRMI